MTFDPNYATNGHFYVSYTTDNGGIYDSGVSHIARFTVSATDPNFTDPSTEVTVITVDQPFNDHDFDWIGFSNRSGDNGNLYICSGDGGGYCDRGEGHVSGGQRPKYRDVARKNPAYPHRGRRHLHDSAQQSLRRATSAG